MNNDLARLVTTAAITRTFTQDKRALEKMVTEIEQRSGISRRAFLGGMIGTAAAVASGSLLTAWIEPEKILWTPGMPTVLTPVDVRDLTDLDRVVRYIGKKNFGSMWEPAGTKLEAMCTLNAEEFRSTLKWAVPYLRWHDTHAQRT